MAPVLLWIWTPLSRIAPELQRALIATEDASFVHERSDWEGISGAALYNLEAGELKRGGSTITQQVTKNLYLSSEHSLFLDLVGVADLVVICFSEDR